MPSTAKPAIHNLVDLKQIPLRAPNLKEPTTLDSVVKLENLSSPTEIDHYQIQRVVDIYVTPSGEDLGKLTTAIQQTIADAKLPSNIRVNLRGMVEGMNASFKSFAHRLRHFVHLAVPDSDRAVPIVHRSVLIMLAIPMGFIGVLIILPLTHTTLNVMSLMGVLMLIGIADSNSILIVDFAHKLEEQGLSVADAVVTACRVRLRPDSDDFARHHHRHDPHGDEARRRRRAVYAHGARHHRRLDLVGASHGVHRPGRLSAGLRKEENECSADSVSISSISQRWPSRRVNAAPKRLPEADAPGRRGAGDQESSADSGRAERSQFRQQQIVENRAAYYPERERRNHRLARQQPVADRRRRSIGFAPVRPLRTRRGRSPVDHRFRPHPQPGRQCALQGAGHRVRLSKPRATTCCSQVNRAYFDVLHAQAVVKVAEQTVSARQLLSDQVTELARNKLKSQLDVSFADVNVSEAKLLLIRAQEGVQQALAELGRAMGSDQPANYQLVDEPLPPGPPAKPDRPGGPGHSQPAGAGQPALLARRRVQVLRSGEGSVPADRQRRGRRRIHSVHQYAGHGAHSGRVRRRGGEREIPVFNGHLFSARREAAHQRAMESDQRLRDEQQRVSRDVRVAWAGAITRFSASTSPRNFFARPRWRWIWRKDATISGCLRSSS